MPGYNDSKSPQWQIYTNPEEIRKVEIEQNIAIVEQALRDLDLRIDDDYTQIPLGDGVYRNFGYGTEGYVDAKAVLEGYLHAWNVMAGRELPYSEGSIVW